MRISQDGRISRYYVEGGFVEVAGEQVTVLTDRVIPVDQLDQAVIQEQLGAARARRATTPESMAARERAVDLSRAQLRVSRRGQ